MKFVIVGTGGTGGVTGAYLAEAGNDVTFIARGKHLSAIRENGLTLRSAHRGELHIQPARACTMEEYRGTPDVIFVCVKYYGLPAATDFVRRAAGPDTLVIPILNVFGTGAVMQKELPGITVLDGCIYVFASIAAPGVIDQPQSIPRVIYGFRPDQEDRHLEHRAKELETVMQAAEIRCHYSENICRDALQKFALVSPMGAAGLYLNAKSDDFQHPGETRELFIGLVREVAALGQAMGIVFQKDLVEVGLKAVDSFAAGLTTSMQRDVERGGPSEFRGLVDRIVDLGKEYNIPVPLYTKISEWGKAKGL